MESEQFGQIQELRRQRVEELLKTLAARDVSQTEVARRVGVPASYLTDVKRGTRPLSQLFARRLAEAFRVDYQYLLGKTDEKSNPDLGLESAAPGPPPNIRLPVFPHPIAGAPCDDPRWDGSTVELSGVAALRARMASNPYLLRFGQLDRRGRLRLHDLLLVSQTIKPDAEIQVILTKGKMYLARLLPDGSWERVAPGQPKPTEVDVRGHVVAIVWGLLENV